MGQSVIIKRSIFVKFFMKYYNINEALAHYIFTCWVFFIKYSAIRAGADDNVKLALSQHLALVSNDTAALLAAAPLPKENYKSFVERTTPALLELMKDDLPYIDAKIKDYEIRRKSSPGRKGDFDSLSVDLSLNKEKPLYERTIEVFDSAGLSVYEKTFGVENFLGSVADSVSEGFSNFGEATLVELGLKERDVKVVVAGQDTTKVKTTNADVKDKTSSNSTAAKDGQGRVSQVDEGMSIFDGIDKSDLETKVRKGRYIDPSGSGAKRDIYIKMIDKDRDGNLVATDSMKVSGSDTPLLDMLTGGIEK